MSNNPLPIVAGPELTNPEYVEVADCYLKCHLNIYETAARLGVLPDYVTGIIALPAVASYIHSIEGSRGLKNSRTFFDELEEMIGDKRKEMFESGLASSYDLLDMMTAFHKMKMEEEKLAVKKLELEVKRETAKIAGARGRVNNTQVNIGTETVAKGLPAVLQAIMEAK